MVMFTCKECIESLMPNDPRVRSGRYHLCSCDYCDKPDYYREIEKTKELPQEEPFSNRQWDKVQQLQAEIEYYRRERAVLLLEANKVKPKRKVKYV